jgi:hypothetical protein
VDVEVVPPTVVEVLLELEVEDVPEVLPVLELAESDSEMIAKSILPDPGLRMTSLMVPKESPVEPLMSAPINLLARTSCPIRPVGLRPVELELPGYVPGVAPPEEEEVWACAPSARHAAQNTINLINCFRIMLSFVVDCFVSLNRHHCSAAIQTIRQAKLAGTCLNGE